MLQKEPRRRDSNLLALLKFEYDCCEITGFTRGLHLHHVILRSQGGDDVRANIVCMSDDLHDRYHAADKAVWKQLAEHIATYRPDTMIYLAKKLGKDGCEVWFERHGFEQTT